MTARLAVGVGCQPVRVRLMHVVIGGMWIRARDHHHSQLPTPGDEVTEGVLVAKPQTPMMERDSRGVIGNAATGAETNGVGARAFELIGPGLGLEFGGGILQDGGLVPM